MAPSHDAPAREQVPGAGPAPGGPAARSVQVAQGGIRTTQDIKDLGVALAEDILLGAIGHRVASPVVRSVSMTIRAAEYEHRHGDTAIHLADSRRPRPDRAAEALAKEEADLAERLRAVRAARGATE